VWTVQLAIGLALALLLVGTIFATMIAAGWVAVRGVAPPDVLVLAVIVGAGRALAVAVVEEAIFRAGVLAYLQRPIGTAGAVAVSSAAFALVHAWNANATPLAIGNLLVAGALFALAYLVGRGFDVPFATEERSAKGLAALAYAMGRGLALPVGLHAGWNFFEGSVFGFPVSGSTRASVLRLAVSGPELATGGGFGPEGGLVGLAAIALTWLVLWAVRRRVPLCPPLTPGG
jgi:membrane protease YdiL (CAAX protease family)